MGSEAEGVHGVPWNLSSTGAKRQADQLVLGLVASGGDSLVGHILLQHSLPLVGQLSQLLLELFHGSSVWISMLGLHTNRALS